MMSGNKFSNTKGIVAVVQYIIYPVMIHDRDQEVTFKNALERFNNDDPTVLARYDKGSHTYFIAASKNGLLKAGLENFRTNYLSIDAKVNVSDMQVCYRESCSGSAHVFMAKSANKQIKLYTEIKSIDLRVCNEMEEKTNNTSATMSELEVQDFVEELDLVECGDKVWYMKGSSLLIEGRDLHDKGIPREYISNRKNPMVSGFDLACEHGPLIGEPIRGCRFFIVDMAGPQNRSQPFLGSTNFAGQVMPATRKLCHGALMNAQPMLHEPIYHTTIASVPQDKVSRALEVLVENEALIHNSDEKNGLVTISARMPVRNSIGLVETLRHEVDCNSIVGTHTFCGDWQRVPGDPFTEDSICYNIVKEIRKRKGMSEIKEHPCNKLVGIREIL